MRTVKSVVVALLWSAPLVLTISCGGGGTVTPTAPSNVASPPASGGLAFTTPNLGGISAGQANSGYSFCRPPISGNDLCGSTSTNPSGGTPPYTFELGTAGGFPPIGMHLNLNGTLTGTPSVAGTSNFVVCAVDLTRSSKCDTVQFIVDVPSATPPPPPPASGSRYAATYDFSFVHPSPGGSATEVLNQFWFVRTDGLVGSSDRTVSGSVDSSGNVRFTGPCWTSSGGTATFTGTLSDVSPKTGSGTYVCALNGINGGTWRVYNGR